MEVSQSITETREYFLGAANGLLEALAAKSDETGDHVRFISHVADCLGRRMKLEATRLRDLHYAAELHDIGKLRIPEAILHKPGPLTADEYRIMKKHPGYGFDMITRLHLPAKIGLIVSQHHEWFNGQGYPLGLAGMSIILEARIFAVADAYEAQTRDRVYRKARTHGDAVKEVLRCSGVQFDPDVADQLATIDELELVDFNSKKVWQ
jgi:HD-GYP domain-containing protein (c-di-GMP phosphodiesterase class II)